MLCFSITLSAISSPSRIPSSCAGPCSGVSGGLVCRSDKAVTQGKELKCINRLRAKSRNSRICRGENARAGSSPTRATEFPAAVTTKGLPRRIRVIAGCCNPEPRGARHAQSSDLRKPHTAKGATPPTGRPAAGTTRAGSTSTSQASASKITARRAARSGESAVKPKAALRNHRFASRTRTTSPRRRARRALAPASCGSSVQLMTD
jgi:hypothetical protein